MVLDSGLVLSTAVLGVIPDLAVGTEPALGGLHVGLSAGLLLFGLLGLAVGGGSGSALDRLAEKVERLIAGEYDLDAEIDRTDEVGRLYETIGELADSLREWEKERKESEQYRQQLYEIASETAASDEEKIQQLLELGRERLDVEAGFISHIDLDTGRYDIENAVGSHLVEVGDETDLSEMYCERTIESEGPLAIYNALEEGWEDHPSYEEIGVSCYLGAKILVDNDLYGTLCFVSEQPHEEPFTSEQKAFIDLMARWVSHVFERRKRDRERAESERYRRQVYDITSDRSLTDDEKIRRLLELGRERFDVENGVITDIDVDTGRYRIETAVGSDFVEEGAVTNLMETFCRKTITSEDVLGIYNATEEGYDADPGYTEWGISCYLGGKILVGDELYGTLCFVDDDPRDESFTHDEKAFIDLMARWVSHVYERREHQRELRLKNRAMEAAPIGITITDASQDDNPLVHANEGFEEVTGYPADEAIGRNCRFLQGEKTQEEPVAQLREAVDAEESTTAELRNYRKDGTAFWNRVTIAPVEDDDGDVTNFVGFQEDVTERKTPEQQLQALVANTSNPIYIKDLDGRYQFMNEAAASLFDLEPSAAVGKRDVELFEAESAADIRQDDEYIIETGETIAEERVRYIDGEEHVFIANKFPYQDEDGEIIGVMGISRDIAGRKQREEALERTTNLLQQAQRMAAVGGWELDISGDPPYEPKWSDEIYELFEIDLDEALEANEILEFFHPDDRAERRAALERALEAGEGWDDEARVVTADGNERWVRSIGEPVLEDGEVVELFGSVQDITEQKERELALESLHETTRELLRTETAQEVADLVIEAAADVLGVPGAGVYLLDTESNRLEPTSFTPTFVELSGGAPVTPSTDSVVWDAFFKENSTVFDDAQLFDADLEAGLAVPIGEHGVFVVASPSPIGAAVQRLAETLVATTEAVFDRLDSEANLREHEAELETQNQRLRRQMQIDDIIRRIDQSLIGAGSREEIETAVCERLTEAKDIAFAWIGSFDASGTELVPRAWAGADREYLDTVALDVDESVSVPAVTTANTEAPTAVTNIVERLKDEPWRKHALANDFHSVISVPLSFDEYFYGVLTVYADEPGLFGDLEQTVFAELGENIANSINTVNTRQALYADTAIELTLEFDTPDAFLARVAREVETAVRYKGLATYSDEEATLFFITDGDPETVETVLDELLSVTGYRLINESDGEAVFEATVTGDVVAARLVRHGGSPKSIRATPSKLEVVVDVPPTTDIRDFVEMLEEQYPSVELTGRRDIQRDGAAGQQGTVSLLEPLTERQQEVLRTAYFAGFFEFPRESTGEDVAEILGVSQPTVNRHLRRSQQRLFEQLFGGAEAVADS